MTPHWQQRFFEMARLVAGWSKDPSTQVGAVIVSPRRRVVSVGFNGLPAGIEDDPEHLADRERKLAMVLHAEENAILFAQRDLSGCAIFTWPLPPCAHCAAKIVQAGIAAVHVPANPPPERWRSSVKMAFAILAEAGVAVIQEGSELRIDREPLAYWVNNAHAERAEPERTYDWVEVRSPLIEVEPERDTRQERIAAGRRLMGK